MDIKDVTPSSHFTGYAKGWFSRDEQLKIRECCDDSNRRGLKFILSNSATDFAKEQYATYNVTIVQAKRAINSNAAKRGGEKL